MEILSPTPLARQMRSIRRFAEDGTRRLREDSSGGVAVTFAVALPMLMAVTGAAIDYANAVAMKSRLQAATDAGVLAAATEDPMTPRFKTVDGRRVRDLDFDGALRRVVETMVVSTFQSQTALVPEVHTKIDGDGTITTYANAVVPTYLGAFLNVANVPVKATSQVKRGSARMEIALVLDTTGSMTADKIAALRTAATNLTNTVFAIPNAAARVKMSVVPFAQYVNIGTQFKGASWLSGTDDVTTSGVDTGTEYPNAQYLDPYIVSQTCYSDGTPYDCSYTAYGRVDLGVGVPYSRPYTYTATWKGCVGSRNYPLDLQDVVDSGNKVPGFLDIYCASPLIRLTNSANTVNTAIAAMTVGGETYIPAGLLWGWRSLSSRPPFADGADAASGAKKFMVVMTDGQNTLAPTYPYHSPGSAVITNSLTAQTCQKIKDDGVAVYAVALAVTDPATKALLSNCASATENYYDAATTGELVAAFSRIGSEITAIRLTK